MAKCSSKNREKREKRPGQFGGLSGGTVQQLVDDESTGFGKATGKERLKRQRLRKEEDRTAEGYRRIGGSVLNIISKKGKGQPGETPVE